jgi:hypothetical protein
LRNPQLVLAIPVAPTETLIEMRQEADDVVCLEAHQRSGAIAFEKARRLERAFKALLFLTALVKGSPCRNVKILISHSESITVARLASLLEIS